MKRIFLCLLAGTVLMVSVSSCATMKRDCQGNKHVRLKNGVYL
ncbi:MAG TPA: hypothetical protein VHK69_15130 [Chitinophagaceae bacterium]|jgi:hypothetical protein|nr:hypothetical protein [Chitinophagaceae bacterium]